LIDRIGADTAVETRIGRAFVDIGLTKRTSIARRTETGEVVHRVETRSAVLARIG
jgi:hypothetical protein